MNTESKEQKIFTKQHLHEMSHLYKVHIPLFLQSKNMQRVC